MSESEITVPIRTKPLVDVTPVINDVVSLTTAIAMLENGSGDVAIDAERASGFKYHQRAYLLQIYRKTAPVVLIDPIDLDLTKLRNWVNQMPWILHAATQDLPCLNELGMFPPKLFDTELAAKLVGMPKVGLAALTESLIGVGLAKEHSAVNWSIRPLDPSWLSYAALDVELLPDLQQILQQKLIDQDRLEWANQEFDVLKKFKPNSPKEDQWRRTSGIHELPKKRQKAIVQHLWLMRDEIAKSIDLSPGKLLNDRVIVAIAKEYAEKPVSAEKIRSMIRSQAMPYLTNWVTAVDKALNLSEAELPTTTRNKNTIPHPKSWEEVNPDAFLRWLKYRPAANDLAGELEIAPEVLVSPEVLRKFCWDEPNYANIFQHLVELGCKPWSAKLLNEKFSQL